MLCLLAHFIGETGPDDGPPVPSRFNCLVCCTQVMSTHLMTGYMDCEVIRGINATYSLIYWVDSLVCGLIHPCLLQVSHVISFMDIRITVPKQHGQRHLIHVLHPGTVPKQHGQRHSIYVLLPPSLLSFLPSFLSRALSVQVASDRNLPHSSQCCGTAQGPPW